jgi:branched-chain amino acid transport system permease protein
MDALTLVVAGLANGSLYALVALGLVLIYKTQDVVNFAHGEVLMIGAFVGYTVFQTLGWSYPVALIIAVIACGVLGALVERFASPARQPLPHAGDGDNGPSLRSKGGAAPFGAHLHVPAAVPVDGADHRRYRDHLAAEPGDDRHRGAARRAGVRVLPLDDDGQADARHQQNLMGARLVGINTGRIFSATWALACLAGGAAGVLAGPVSLLYPDMGTNFLLKGFAAAVLGGFESVPGAIIGGLLIGIIEMLFGGYVSTAFQHVSAFIIIIIVLFIRPQGLFGRKPIHRARDGAGLGPAQRRSVPAFPVVLLVPPLIRPLRPVHRQPGAGVRDRRHRPQPAAGLRRPVRLRPRGADGHRGLHRGAADVPAGVSLGSRCRLRGGRHRHRLTRALRGRLALVTLAFAADPVGMILEGLLRTDGVRSRPGSSAVAQGDHRIFYLLQRHGAT